MTFEELFAIDMCLLRQLCMIVEADVHTATPSLSNAAATWAGWAVTAVTAKFYRSHSDTARVAHSAKSVLSKPGSLGKY